MALWREALLAQAVLRGVTRGYRHHPQLIRFREHAAPKAAIATYLHAIADEAEKRGYAFDRTRVGTRRTKTPIAVTEAQLRFEWLHLKRKLRKRGRSAPREAMPESHPSFVVIRGAIASWERGPA